MPGASPPFNPEPAGRKLKRDAHLRLGEDGRLWRYHRGVYLPDGDQWAKQQIRDVHLNGSFTKHKLDEILAWCRAEVATARVNPSRDVINLRNGLLDWRTGELGPHDPDVVSVSQLPIDYIPGATCTVIGRFLNEVLPSDAVELVQEFIGLLCIPDPRYRKAALLLGSGRNGKTTFLSVIRALIGQSNISSVPLQAFSEDRFAAAELYGKLANVCGDLDARALRRSDMFKQVTGGGDVIQAQRKYGQPFSFIPYARLLFSANEAPGTADQTEAYFDRWLVFPFDRRFTEEQADPKLIAKLLQFTELSGLLNLGMGGLRRLDTRGRFDIPKSIAIAGQAYREKTDTVVGFVEEECIKDIDAWVNRPQLYKAYRIWCMDSGRMAVSVMRFNEHLRARGFRESAYAGERRWVGLGLSIPAQQRYHGIPG